MLLALRVDSFIIKSWSRLCLATLLIHVTQITLILISLGALGLIRFTNSSILSLIWSIFVVITCGIKAKKTRFPQLQICWRTFFISIGLFVPIVALLIIKSFNSLLQIPLDYDSAAYHLPFVVEWLKTGSLTEVYYNAFAGPIGYYPSNYELLDLWTFLPFGNDFFVSLINFPLFAFLGLALFKLLRNWGTRQEVSLVATAVPFYMLIFIHQAGLALVDLFFSLMFVIALYFLSELNSKLQNLKHEKNSNEFALVDFYYFGLSLGLFIGTKYLGLIYGSLLVLTFLAIGFVGIIRKQITVKLFTKGTMLAGLMTILTGGFFYIRNWLSAGNPLFPVEVKLGSWQIFQGYSGGGVNELLQTTSLLKNVTDWQSLSEFLTHYFYITSPIGVLMTLLPVLLLLAAISCIIQKRKATVIFKYILLALALTVLFYLYWKAPYTFRDLHANIRYSMPFLLVGTLAFGYWAHRHRFFRLLFYTICALSFSYSFLFTFIKPASAIPYSERVIFYLNLLSPTSTGFYFGLYLLLIFAAVALIYILANNATKPKLLISILLIGFILTGSTTLTDYSLKKREEIREEWAKIWFKEDKNMLALYNLSEWLNENAPGANVAYTGFNFHYHLFGRDLARDVNYVNINSCFDCRYFDYKDEKDSIRTNPSYTAWLENLKKSNKQFLVISLGSSGFVKNHELDWASSNPRTFEQVYSSNNTYIFKIRYAEEIAAGL